MAIIPLGAVAKIRQPVEETLQARGDRHCHQIRTLPARTFERNCEAPEALLTTSVSDDLLLRVASSRFRWQVWLRNAALRSFLALAVSSNISLLLTCGSVSINWIIEVQGIVRISYISWKVTAFHRRERRGRKSVAALQCSLCDAVALGVIFWTPGWVR